MSLLRKVADTSRIWFEAAGHLLPRARSGRPPAPPRKSLLLLTRDYPPSLNAGVYRVSAIVRAAVAREWGVEVIPGPLPTRIDPAGEALEKSLGGGIVLHRWERRVMAPIWRVSPELDGGFESISSIVRAGLAASAVPSVVLSSGPTFAEHVAGAVLARRWSVPLVLDYRDEWTEAKVPFVNRGKFDRFWERFALARSSAVLFTTEAARRHYLAAFPSLGHARCHVVRNGWDLDLPGVDHHQLPAERAGGRITIGFFGWLGEHWDFPAFHRVLLDLASAEGQAPGVEFRFVGTKTPENRELLADPRLRGVVTDAPQVAFSEAREQMRQCAGLFLMNSPVMERMLPAKLFEYVASRRPILLFGEGGEIEGALHGLPGARIVPVGSRASLIQALKDIEGGTAQAEIDSAPEYLFQRFSREEPIQFLFRLLDSLRQGPGS